MPFAASITEPDTTLAAIFTQIFLTFDVLANPRLTIEFIAIKALITAIWAANLTAVAEVNQACSTLANAEEAVDIEAIIAFVTTKHARICTRLAMLNSARPILTQARQVIEVEASDTLVTAIFAND